MNTVKMDVLDFTPEHLEEWPDCTIEQAGNLVKRESVTWINVTGVRNSELINGLGQELSLHPLTCEDILRTGQRPKAEEFPGYIFLVLKMLDFNKKERGISVEHVSLVLGRGFVISFQEKEGDVFDPVRTKLRASAGVLRTRGADYLAYTLMDTVVDNYFIALEGIGEHLEIVESSIIANPMPSQVSEIHRLKKCILGLRRAVWPLREEISSLENHESELILPGTATYLRNLYDHTIQVIEIIEMQRELLSGMHDSYLTSVSNRMNDIMKVLTIIATVFIPLTFITGLYGMNFRHMPELTEQWAYPAVLFIMVVMAGGMILYFKKKKWF